MQNSEKQIEELSVDEYFFLTENLEIISPGSVESGMKYLLFNKKRRLYETVRRAVAEELTERERAVALGFWNEGLAAGEIARLNRISRSSVYRIVEKARAKLEDSLKYVVMYEKSLKLCSAAELIEFVTEDKRLEN